MRRANASRTAAPSATDAAARPWIGFWSWAGALTAGALTIGVATAGLANVYAAPPTAPSSISPAAPQPVPADIPAMPAPKTSAVIAVPPLAIVLAKADGPGIKADVDGDPATYQPVSQASGVVPVIDLETKLGLVVQNAEGRFAGRSNADMQGAVKTALEDFIIQSGAAPMRVRDALEALLLECRDTFRARDIDKFRACPGSPQSLQTIETLLKVVVASIDAQEAPGAGGAPGFSIFSSTPPPPLGAGGSNYQPQ